MTPLRPRSDNTTGLLGVSLYKRSKKFQAQIQVNGKKIHLGYYVNKFDARDAYERARLLPKRPTRRGAILTFELQEA